MTRTDETAGAARSGPASPGGSGADCETPSAPADRGPDPAPGRATDPERNPEFARVPGCGSVTGPRPHGVSCIECAGAAEIERRLAPRRTLREIRVATALWVVVVCAGVAGAVLAAVAVVLLIL